MSQAGKLEKPANRHPSVMFEIIARDQAKMQTFYSKVFGWSYRMGSGGFAYIDFPTAGQALLGGIGQASRQPGFEPGHSFYLQVESVAAAIDAAIEAGGTEHMPATRIDGYHFAMILDPEGNPIGLIEPFAHR